MNDRASDSCGRGADDPCGRPGPLANSVIDRLGVLTMLALLSHSILSYIISAANARPDAVGLPNQAAFLAGLGRRFDATPGWLAELLVHGGALADDRVYFLAYSIPLVVATAAGAWLAIRISIGGMPARSGIDRLFLWAVLFTAVSFPAFPMMTQDFWFSAVWGQQIVDGINPYYTPFTPEEARAFPFDEVPAMMTYGPLWAVISAGVMWLSGGDVWVTALLFKSVLAAMWIASLWTIRAIMRNRPDRTAAVAIIAFGWLPIGNVYIAGEGHNDILMVCLMLVWMLHLARGNMAGPVALAASAACKYTSGVLVAVDMIFLFRKQGFRVAAYLLRGLPALLLTLVVFALFCRSVTFFDATRGMAGWQWLEPADMVRVIEHALAVDLAPLRWLVRCLFVPLAAWTLVALYRRPSEENAFKASAAVMSAVVFSLSEHLWPWFMLWILAPAVLVPNWWFSRWIFAVSALAPFAIVPFWRYEHTLDPFYTRMLPSLPLYLGATILLLLSLSRDERAAVRRSIDRLSGRLRPA